MFDIRYGLYFIIFAIPAYLVRFSVFGIPTNLLEMMIYILFACWLFGETENEKRLGKVYDVLKGEKILFWGTVLLLSGVVLSAFFSSDARTSMGIVKGWFFDPILFFLVFVSCVKSEKDARNALLSLALSGFIVSLIAVIYYLSGNVTFDGRLRAFYLSPNHLAMYLAPAFLIFFYFAINRIRFVNGNKKNALFVVSGMTLVLSSIILTHSYGAIFAVFFAIVFYLYVYHNKKLSALFMDKKCLFIAIIMVLIGLYATSVKIGQIDESSGRSSFHSRLMIWDASLQMIKESPIFGIGPGTFQEKYLSLAKTRTEPYLEWAVPQPHNIFLAFYLQTGFVGFVGFLLLLLFVFKKGGGSRIAMLLMAYTVIHGLIDTTYWKNDLAIIFWLIIGFSVIRKNLDLQEEKYVL